MLAYNCMLSCHPLLESDDAVFHILKGAPQEVKGETTSPHKSLLFHEVNQKEVWRTGRLSVHSLYLWATSCFFFFFFNYLHKLLPPAPLLAVMSSQKCNYIHHCTGCLPSIP